MNIISHKLCSIQGRLFELSVKYGFESNNFVKVYMDSDIAAKFNSAYDRSQWMGEEYLFDELVNTHKLIKGKTYSYDVMFWMGYSYAYWAINYVEQCSRIVRIADPKKMAENYAGLHTVSTDLAVQDLIMQYLDRGNNGAKIQEEIYKRVLKEIANSKPGMTDYEKQLNDLKIDLAFALKNEATKAEHQRQLQFKRNNLIRREHINYINHILNIIDKSNISYREKVEYSYMVRDIAKKAINVGFSKAQFLFLDSIETRFVRNKGI